MSSILKALKKLEQEKASARPTGPIPVFSQPRGESIGGVAGWFLNPWFRWVAVGCIMIALCLAVVYFYQQSRSKPLNHRNPTGLAGKSNAQARIEQPRPGYPESRPAVEKKTGPPKVDASKLPRPPAGKVPPAPAQSGLRGPGGNRGPQKTAALPTNDPQSMQAPEVPAEPRTPVQGPTIHPEAKAALRPDISVPRENKAPARNPAAEVEAKTESTEVKKASVDTYKNTPPLTDGRLKVHAIAWSPVPENRMAVMNNRVIYEGDSVDDFVVVAIRSDDVVVREKGKGVWRVVFGRP